MTPKPPSERDREMATAWINEMDVPSKYPTEDDSLAHLLAQAREEGRVMERANIAATVTHDVAYQLIDAARDDKTGTQITVSYEAMHSAIIDLANAQRSEGRLEGIEQAANACSNARLEDYALDVRKFAVVIRALAKDKP